MTKQVSIRVDAELREEIERAGAEDRRPVSNLVRNVLSDWATKRRQHEQEAA